MKPAIYDTFGPPGKHIDASVPVRRWDLGLSYGLLGGATSFLPIAGWGMGWTDIVRALTLDPAFYSRIENPQWMSDWSTLAIATTVGLAAGAGMAYLGLIPRSNQWVVSGPRLLEGKDAIKEARRRSPSMKERLADRFAMAIQGGSNVEVPQCFDLFALRPAKSGVVGGARCTHGHSSCSVCFQPNPRRHR